eukprot:scaffold21487_cov105-Isochrysis_galbana.AAC.7
MRGGKECGRAPARAKGGRAHEQRRPAATGSRTGGGAGCALPRAPEPRRVVRHRREPWGPWRPCGCGLARCEARIRQGCCMRA